MDSILPACTTIIENFALVTTEELSKIIFCMNKTTCASAQAIGTELSKPLTIIINQCLLSTIYINDPC